MLTTNTNCNVNNKIAHDKQHKQSKQNNTTLYGTKVLKQNIHVEATLCFARKNMEISKKQDSFNNEVPHKFKEKQHTNT